MGFWNRQQVADARTDRRSFLRQTVVAGAVAAPVVAASTLIAPKVRAAAPESLAALFKQIQNHENTHVDVLTLLLGQDARPMPTFQNLEQKNLTQFEEVSRALENTGVGAYLGALPYIFDTGYVSDAGSIALIEGRHAGVLNYLAGEPITANVLEPTVDQSFETALSIEQVVDNAMPFIKSLNNGPDLTFSTTPSDENDIDILNFALALEYLEAAFYNMNVPKFFK